MIYIIRFTLLSILRLYVHSDFCIYGLLTISVLYYVLKSSQPLRVLTSTSPLWSMMTILMISGSSISVPTGKVLSRDLRFVL